MISSITLRGSRIELAVFTTSVRIASRRAVVEGARGPPRRLPAARAAARPRRWASTASGGGSPRPQASTTKSSPSRAIAAQRALVGRSGDAAERAGPGSARRAAATCAGVLGAPSATSAAAKRAGASELARPLPRRHELVLERAGAALEAAPQRPARRTRRCGSSARPQLATVTRRRCSATPPRGPVALTTTVGVRRRRRR